MLLNFQQGESGAERRLGRRAPAAVPCWTVLRWRTQFLASYTSADYSSGVVRRVFWYRRLEGTFLHLKGRKRLQLVQYIACLEEMWPSGCYSHTFVGCPQTLSTRTVFIVYVDICPTIRAVKCHLHLDRQSKQSEPNGKNTRNVLLLFIKSEYINKPRA